MNERAIIITGASTGIGAASALELDRLGYRVFAGVRNDEAGQRLRETASHRLIPVRMDVTDVASLREAAERIALETGEMGVYGLFCNAGIVVASPWELVPMEDLRNIFEVNVFGTVATLQAFLPLLRKSAERDTAKYTSRIVVTGSISGRCVPAYIGPYSASKHALESICDALRIELRAWRMGVSLLEPGAVKTPIWGKAHRTTALRIERPEVAAKMGLYEADVAKVFEVTAAARDHGMPVEMITRRVVHAITATTPKTRYPIGRTTGLAIWLRRQLPDRVWDMLLKKDMKLK